jgi:hypothetical protein
MANHHRRQFISFGLQSAALICASLSARATCVDPDELPGSVQSMRESLEYTDAASDTKAVCRGCSFFKPANTADSCGHCEVLSGPVSATGHCVSWTKRS